MTGPENQHPAPLGRTSGKIAFVFHPKKKKKRKKKKERLPPIPPFPEITSEKATSPDGEDFREENRGMYRMNS
jgi:hypothetical protein